MSKKKHRMVEYLESLRDRKDTAALAKLRRGLGKPKGTPEMYPFVVRLSRMTGRLRKEPFSRLAFALHPEPAPEGRSMGNVFAGILRVQNTESIEKRFVRLLEADIDDVGHHLRQAINLAKSKQIAVDYHSLIYDVKYWNHDEQFVQLRWAKDFWGTNRNEDGDNTLKGGD